MGTGYTGGIRTRALSNRYPATKGTTADSTSQTGKQMNLMPTGTHHLFSNSFISKRMRKGID